MIDLIEKKKILGLINLTPFHTMNIYIVCKLMLQVEISPKISEIILQI